MATKKSSPLKKSELSSASKKKTTIAKKETVSTKKAAAPVKKSSVVKKEVKPISIEETKLITKSINSDTKTSKSGSRSVDILKDAIETAKAKQEVKKEDKKESKQIKSEVSQKTTYSKSDLIKKAEETKEKEVKKEEKVYQPKEEIKKEVETVYEKPAVPVKPVTEEKIEEEIEKETVYKPVNNLNNDIYKKEETFEDDKKQEIKTQTGLPDSKPVTSYSVQNTRMEERSRSKKSPIPIIILLLVIAAVGFFVVRFISPKKDNQTVITENIQTNDMLTNETLVSTNALAYGDTNASMPEAVVTNNTLEAAPSIEEPKESAESNKTVNLETPPTPPVEPATPKVPEAPTVTPSVTPPAMVMGDNKMYIIKWRDTLETIALSELGDTRRWPTIYALNENVIITPDSYKFGDKINIPDNKKTLEQMTDSEKRALYEDYMKVASSYQRAGKTQLAEQVKARAKAIYPNY